MNIPGVSFAGSLSSLHSAQAQTAKHGAGVQAQDPDGDHDVDGPGPDTNDGKGRFINVKA